MGDLQAALEVEFEALRAGPLRPVEVAVVDSGIDATHPDLAGRIASAWWVRPADSSSMPPKAVRQKVPTNNDAYGHGTGVAGIIAAIAPNARILDIRVLDETNCGTGDILVAGFQWAVEKRVRLVNLSLACKAKFAQQLHQLCETAYRRNQIVVAAKRNMPLADNGFPAEFSSCVSVDMAKFPSPYILKYRPNNPIEYVARGEEVVTTARGGGYTTFTGTSFATPTVTGLCALLVGAHPDLRPFEVKSLLKAFAV